MVIGDNLSRYQPLLINYQYILANGVARGPSFTGARN